MGRFSNPLSRQTSREKSTSSFSSSTTSGSHFDALAEEIARLQAENRRLRQVTKRIATKIGVKSTANTADAHDDDETPPPAHIILAQAHRLQKLNQLVVELSQVSEISEAYKIVAQYTREIVGAARVSIAILNEPAGQEPFLEVYGLDGQEGALPLGIRLPLYNTQVGRVVTTQKPFRVMDTGTHNSEWLDIKHLHTMGVMACVDVPLISSGRVLGTLNTGVTDPVVYYPEVEEILLQIAAVLASAMEKDQLMQQAQKANK